MTPFPSSLKQLNLSETYGPQIAVNSATNFPLSGWNYDIATNCPNLNYLDLRVCRLTQAAVDFILCNLANNSEVNGGTLLLNYTTSTNGNNAAPSATGAACRTTLINPPRNWNVPPII
jgi:hypothetical protein